MTYQSEQSQDRKVFEWMTEPQNSSKKLLKKPETPSEVDDENWDWERDIYGYECANFTT
jgi:hypothetical protein